MVDEAGVLFVEVGLLFQSEEEDSGIGRGAWRRSGFR